MCGIAGFCDYSNSLNYNILSEMTGVITHRGPDSGGQKIYRCANAKVGLGHRRLSILDLSSQSNQPMERDGVSIVFNGEIYNFREIKIKLKEKGHHFSTDSDTEVIIVAYLEWGMSALAKFIGMFAFALLDSTSEKMYFVRDRVGVKPIYIYDDGYVLLFGSELKSFHQNPLFKKELDVNSLALYLKLNYVPTPHCIFKNTVKLNPGHYIEFNLSTRQKKEIAYWDVVDAYNKPKLDVTYDDALDETEQIMSSAFNYRMVADVPVGVFLSGGYDSSAVAALVQKDRTEKIKTFTIGFHESAYNEADDAKQIANHLGTDHTELYCTPNEAADIFENLPNVYDEPFADNSVVPTILVSQLARKSVKVALSGDGGDEMFAGYDKFMRSINFTRTYPRWLQDTLAFSMSMLKPEQILYFSKKYNFTSRYEKMINIWKSKSPFVALKNISNFITDKEAKKLISSDYEELTTYFDIEHLLGSHNDDLNKLLAIDYKTFLMDNNLAKVDRASMSVSLEVREPFLDQRIIEYVSRLPSNFKVRNGRTKSLLKDIVHKYIDPKLMERPKKPFLAPLDKWFKKEMRDLLLDHVNELELAKHGLFDIDEVMKMRDEYIQGRNVNHRKIWNILVFQIWYNRYFATESHVTYSQTKRSVRVTA